MKKELIFTLFILFYFFILRISFVQALDVTAANGSAAAIQTAVDQVAAAGGGNVYIPAGTFQWNGETVTIPGGVNVFGASPAGCKGHEDNWEHYEASTILHNNQNDRLTNHMFVIDGTGGNDKQTRISGIQFETVDPINESTSWGAKAIYVKEAKNFRIDHCTVQNFGGAQIQVVTGPTTWPNEVGHSSYGLIDHCVFDAPYKDNGGLWYVAYGVAATGNMQPKLNNWNPNTRYYAGKYQDFTDVALIYVEDCNFRRMRHSVDSANGGMVVTRYCIFDHLSDENVPPDGDRPWNSGEVCLHPYWVGGQYPGLLSEAYYNTFLNNDMHRSCPIHPDQPHSLLAIVQRGSSGLYFGNDYYQSEPAPNYQSILIYLRDESEDPPIGSITETYIWDQEEATSINSTDQIGQYVNVYQNIGADGIKDGFINVGGSPAPQLNVNFFLRKPNLAQDGWNYTPYTYPHPLTLDASNSKTISGKLLDKNNQPINVNIIVYQNGTNNIFNSVQTNSTGHYSLQVPNGMYDIQFNFTSVPNYYIRLDSVNLSSDRNDILNYINYSSQRISFFVDFNDSQRIETYSSIQPKRILRDWSVLNNVSSIAQLTNSTWVFNVNEKKLYMIASIPSIPPADYYVTGSGGTYTAMNRSGQTIMTGTNAATVINYILNMMTSGQKVAFQGTFNVLDVFHPKSNITMLFGNSEITADASIPTTHGYSILIILDYLSNVTIDGGFFHGNGCQWAISGYSANSITVQNSYFEGFVGSFGGGVIQLNNGDNHLIQNCIFENYGSDYDFRFSAVALNDCSNSRILHNYVDCGNKAAGLGAWSKGQGGNEIAFNTVKDWSNMFNHCVYIGGTPGTSIHDNECSAPQTSLGGAISVKCRSDVYNNHVYNTPAWGITFYWVEGGAAYGDPAGSKIYNNTIENALDGALVISPRSGTSGPVRDIKYFNNTCIGNWAGNNAACLFIVDVDFDTYNITFQDNKILNMTYGTRFYQDITATLSDIKILRNIFTSVRYPFMIEDATSDAIDTTIAYNDLSAANATTILQDAGINTMVYDNIPPGTLPDKNVPSEKIPPPPSPP